MFNQKISFQLCAQILCYVECMSQRMYNIFSFKFHLVRNKWKFSFGPNMKIGRSFYCINPRIYIRLIKMRYALHMIAQSCVRFYGLEQSSANLDKWKRKWMTHWKDVEMLERSFNSFAIVWMCLCECVRIFLSASCHLTRISEPSATRVLKNAWTMKTNTYAFGLPKKYWC